MTTIEMLPSEIRRPDLLLAQVRERHPFDRPRTLLARVDGPYDRQRASVGLADVKATDEDPLAFAQLPLGSIDEGRRTGRHRGATPPGAALSDDSRITVGRQVS